jgi:pimeloyl-ACP methyl ester carboxylesterase
MTERHPVVFIHGLWLHANSWGPWAELFAAYGYATVAPGWPGEEPTVQATRDSRSALSGRGISEVVQHYAEITAALETRPVLVGHGLGGLLALAMAADTHAAGVIAIDALPVAAMAPPGRELTAWRGAAALSRDEFRMVYGRELSGQESDQLYERWAIPAPDWALREPVISNTMAPRRGARTANSSRGPTLLVASGESGRQGDTRYASAERGLLGAANDVVVFTDRGPSLVIDSGWRQVAASCLSWMDAQEL